MKKWIYGTLLVAAVCLVAACSGYTYYSVGNNNNLGKYRTFAWLPPMGNTTRNPIYDNDVADQKIKDRVTANLESRGLFLKARNPGLLVRYSVMVNNRVKTYDEPAYAYTWGGFYPRYSYRGRGVYWMYRGSYPVYVGDNIYHVPYKEGTLIIDLIDRVSHKVIWRGYGIGEITDPERAVNDLPKVVDGILAKLPLNKLSR